MKKFLTLGMIVMGCSQSAPDELPRPSSFVLSAEDPALASEMTKWADRWSTATGLNISVGEGGIPVTFEEEVWTAEGDEELCALTSVTYDANKPLGWYTVNSIQVERNPHDNCVGWGYSVGHELAHVLSGPVAPHATEGVFFNHMHIGQVYKISENSLTAVCNYAPCTQFNPEE